VIAAAAFLTPLLGVYVPRALAALLIVAAVAVLIVAGRNRSAWPIPRNRIASLLVIALGWALLTIAWGVEAKLSALSGIARLACVIASLLIVNEAARRLATAQRETVCRALAAGFLLALALLAIDRASDASIRRLFSLSPALENPDFVMAVFNRGISVLVLLSFPVSLVLWRRSQILGFSTWAVAFALTLSLPSDSARLAMAFGGVASACAWLAPRLTANIAAALLAIFVLTMPLLAGLIPPPDKIPATGELPIPNSAHHRLQIWRFTAERIAERPLVGWGYDSSRRIPGNTQTIAFAEQALPLHPHNAMLQWWLELGLVGGLLGAAFLAMLAREISRRAVERAFAATAMGQLAAATAIGALSFGIWQGWWVAGLGLSAMALAVAHEKS
jgi:O-antigen ligase